MNKIIMFYGAECPHCKVMMPLVERLEKETGIKIEKLEVWHDEKNANLMRKHEKAIVQASGGIFGTPAFIASNEKRALCGEMPYEELKKWATKK